MSNKILRLVIGLLVSVSLVGCDAFVRKFTRKKKQDTMRQEQVIIAPQEYHDTMSKDEKYQQFFTYWKAWDDELIEALNRNDTNYKKRVDCAEQAIKNLEQMKKLLSDQKQKELEQYLNQLVSLKDDVAADSYGNSNAIYKRKADHIRRMILQKFSYGDIKSSLQ
ncbi:MAG TPA: hypothetical protein PKL77_05750 [Candidatus Omnitrophota bacterium]|nr:hypothetical protein [Candidatus Omnitrophota bacterium]HPT06897.1 hypothetical protein [Candidatus Omnitrophota bacterium]